MANKKNCAGFALMLLLMAGTGFILMRNQPVSRLVETLGQIHPGYLCIGLGLMLLFVGCEAMCSKLILRRLGHRAAYRRCLGYSFTGFYFSSITPSATGGQPAQVYYMSKDGIPAAHGTLDMLLITVCYQLATLILGITAFCLRPTILSDLGGGLSLLLLYGAAATLCLTAGILTVMFAPHLANRLSGWALRALVRLHILKQGEKAEERLERQMEEYHQGAACLRSHPALLPSLLALSLLQLTALYLVPFVVYRAFGLSGHTAVEMAAVQALLTLAVSTLPLPGAVGPSEGGFVKAFALFFGTGLVTPAMLVSRGISFYAFLLISGGVTLLVHLRTRRGKRRPRPARPTSGIVRPGRHGVIVPE